MWRCCHNSLRITWLLVSVLVILEWVWIWCVVVFEVLASNYPLSKFWLIANIYRELAAIRLGLHLNSFSVFFFKFAAVSSLLFVVYTLKIDSNNLSILRLWRLCDQGETFCEGPVLQSYECGFFWLSGLIFNWVKAVGGREGSGRGSQLSSELGCYSLTCCFSEDRFHDWKTELLLDTCYYSYNSDSDDLVKKNFLSG